MWGAGRELVCHCLTGNHHFVSGEGGGLRGPLSGGIETDNSPVICRSLCGLCAVLLGVFAGTYPGGEGVGGYSV